ncbi:MAG: hypothetical protein QM653_15850 [Dysgonomonas sp.]|uniref:hypothetical protein n=1 Tax=Dysgonomonas sp. TaxID=1891233 RepID=UPI0039E612DF
MRCHYTYIIENGKRTKYLIPYCMAVVHSDDIRDCTCSSDYSFAKFEKQRYNDKLEELTKVIKELEEENKSLLEIIESTKIQG